MHISPKNTLSLTTLFTLVLALGTIWFALQLPHVTPDIRRYQDKTIEILTANNQWQTVAYFEWSDNQGKKQHIVTSPSLAMEEPDQLPLYANLNTLMVKNTQLFHALKDGKLTAVTKTNTVVELHHRPRHIQDLPLRFWVVLVFSLVSIIIAGAVFSFGGWRPAVSAYIQNTIVYFLFTTSSNLYGTRQLIINGELFSNLQRLNHIATLYGVSSIMVLLWVSPRPIHQKSIVPWAYGLVSLFLWLDLYQVFQNQVDYFYSILMLGFVGCFILGMYQWWQVRHIAVDKAAMRWIFLSIMMPVTIFSLIYLLPVSLGYQARIPQGYMYGIILLINIGLGFGVLRYKVFELERWWFSIWTWFLGGLSIIVVDVLLLTILPISVENGLMLSVALVGWLYFPMRQWALERIQRKHNLKTDNWLPQVLPLLLNQTDDRKDGIPHQWSKILLQVFEPLNITKHSITALEPEIADSGQTLLIPPLADNQQSYALHHASAGQRLFTKDDFTVLHNLIDITKLAMEITNARLHGARLERERLARDIHDDISSKLLTILHQSTDNQRVVVQETLVELRNLLNQLDTHEVDFSTAIADWRLETSLRLQPYQIKFDWQVDVQRQDAIILSSNEYSNIRRIIREAITNALKYMQNNKISILIEDKSSNLVAFCISNHGQYLPTEHSSKHSGKRGIKNMTTRVNSMGGDLMWKRYDAYFELHFTIAVVRESIQES